MNALKGDGWQGDWPAQLRAEVAASLRGESLGVMLYGSQARGSAETDSDVDVLQVVSAGSGAYRNGRVTVTAYTPAHLRLMAAQGSLFILHLRVDGVILFDRAGVLRGALDSYVPPEDYDILRAALTEAAGALLVEGPELDTYGQAIGRMGIYLLRTLVYAQCAAFGKPTFDVELAADSERLNLRRVLKMRRAPSLSDVDVRAIQAELIESFQVRPHDEPLVDAAVRLASANPHAAGLIGQVISQGALMDYNAFPLPPL